MTNLQGSLVGSQTRRSSLVLTIAMILVLIAGLVVPTPKAHSEELTNPTITNFNIVEDEVEYWTDITLEFDWAVPDSAQSGDHFDVVLPSQLTLPNGLESPLANDDGEVFAHAVVQEDARTIRITMTDLVDARNDVAGNLVAQASVRYETSTETIPGGTTQTFSIRVGQEVYSDDVVIGPREDPDFTTNYKWGTYQDTVPGGYLGWGIVSHRPAATGTVITFKDTMGDGHSMECGDINLYGQLSDGSSKWLTKGNENQPWFVINHCDDTGFSATYTVQDDHVDPSTGELLRPRVQYSTKITDDTLDYWTNTASLQHEGEDQVNRAAVITNATMSGSASGDQRPGRFAVSKSVTGDAIPSDTTFDFDWVCVSPSGVVRNGILEGVPANQVTEVEEDFVDGAECTVTEREDSASVDGYELTAGGPVSVTIIGGAREPVVASLTNSYSQVEKGAVSVGDFVWIDANADGLQNEGERGLPGVTLKLTGPDGRPVTDVDGDAVQPQITGQDGTYLFDNLPTLEPGESYTVTVTDYPPAYSPTLENVGEDTAIDSSTGSETTDADLSVTGAQDLTLDFGFIIEPCPDCETEPPVTETTTVTTEVPTTVETTVKKEVEVTTTVTETNPPTTVEVVTTVPTTVVETVTTEVPTTIVTTVTPEPKDPSHRHGGSAQQCVVDGALKATGDLALLLPLVILSYVGAPHVQQLGENLMNFYQENAGQLGSSLDIDIPDFGHGISGVDTPDWELPAEVQSSMRDAQQLINQVAPSINVEGLELVGGALVLAAVAGYYLYNINVACETTTDGDSSAVDSNDSVEIDSSGGSSLS